MPSLPPFGLGTAALAVFVLCVGFVMLRGVARLLMATLALAVATWAAWLTWRHAPALALDWFGKSDSWVSPCLPVAAFVVAWILTRKTLRSVIRPLDHDAPPAFPLLRTVFGLLLALVPALLIWLLGAVFIHHNGSIAEIRAAARGQSHARGSFGETVAGLVPKPWIETLDPLADSSRVTLAKWIAAGPQSGTTHTIDPATGRPVPRARVVDHPELQGLAKEGRFGALLRHPLLTRALEDPSVQEILAELKNL